MQLLVVNSYKSFNKRITEMGQEESRNADRTRGNRGRNNNTNSSHLRQQQSQQQRQQTSTSAPQRQNHRQQNRQQYRQPHNQGNTVHQQPPSATSDIQNNTLPAMTVKIELTQPSEQGSAYGQSAPMYYPPQGLYTAPVPAYNQQWEPNQNYGYGQPSTGYNRTNNRGHNNNNWRGRRGGGRKRSKSRQGNNSKSGNDDSA